MYRLFHEPAAFYDFHQGVVSVFAQSGRSSVTNRGSSRSRNVPAWSTVPRHCPLPTKESAQQQASQFLHDVYGGYWPTFYSFARRSAAVDVAVAVDTVPLGNSSEFGFVVPASNLVVFSLPGSPCVSLGATVSTSLVPIEATSTATQPAVTLLNQKNHRSEPNLGASSLPSPNLTITKPAPSHHGSFFF